MRRTTTIDTRWPDGRNGDMAMVGFARDLYSPQVAVAAPITVEQDSFTARVSGERRILEIATTPDLPDTAKLVGAQAGSQLRAAIGNTLPGELARGSPLYLLLDDVAGASLVAQWAWSQWTEGWDKVIETGPQAEARRNRMIGVCIGFSPESPVVTGGPEDRVNYHQIVPPLDAGPDPDAWHVLPAQGGQAAARRARRIDVRVEGDLIVVDSHFQDSCTRPDGQRLAVHEYLLSATADRATMTLRSLSADPRVLPFGYCPNAILNIGRLVGTSIADLRRTVLTEFARTEGCTHLNDMMRAMAEVPQLVAAIDAQSARQA